MTTPGAAYRPGPLLIASRGISAADFAAQLNEQVAHEFAAHQQYVACAVHYEAQTLPRIAAFFYRQALEERDHAMMMIQFLLDTDAEVAVPGVAAPRTAFDDVVTPIEISLAQEKRVSRQINALAATAREQHDYAAEQFMQWFIAEQIEEVATMGDLLNVARRAGDRVAEIEDYLVREAPGEGEEDAGAPRIAGAGG